MRISDWSSDVCSSDLKSMSAAGETVVAVQPARPVPVEATPQSMPQVREMDDVERELSAPLDPRFTFDSFITGKSNELARAAALRVAESPTVTYNPLFLYGGVGLGKTHLMPAIGWHIRQRFPERRVVYLPAEKLRSEEHTSELQPLMRQ